MVQIRRQKQDRVEPPLPLEPLSGPDQRQTENERPPQSQLIDLITTINKHTIYRGEAYKGDSTADLSQAIVGLLRLRKALSQEPMQQKIETMESQSVWLKDLIELAVHVYNPQLPFSPDTVARYSRNISSESHSHPISFSRAVENIQRSTNNISLLAYTFTQAKARIGQATEWIFGRHGRIASHHEEIKTYIRDINALQSDIYDKDSTRQKLHSALRQLLEHFLNIYTDPNISPEGRASTNALLFSAAQHLSRIPAEALEKEPELIFLREYMQMLSRLAALQVREANEV